MGPLGGSTSPEIDTTFTWTELQHIVTQLVERVGAKWTLCTSGQRADASQNAVREVYSQPEIEPDLKELFRTIRRTRIGQESHVTDSWLTKHHNIHRNFRQWVIGRDRSRAKILAMILSQGESYLSRFWDRLLVHFRLFVEGKEDPTLSDTSLPFSSSQVDGHFGIENSSHFSSGQDKFCPIDPVEIDINFENSNCGTRMRLIGLA